MFPHYFEKQKTDGVDHQIYVGALAARGRPLRPALPEESAPLAAHGHVRRSRSGRSGSRPRLPVPLETTHLVLVQHAPLSIRFRFDEKRFDVDGAYDVRYEIVKKRIDKAVITGPDERVTQPGKIAIVYSQPAEARVPRLHRVPAGAGLPHRRGRGARARGAAGRPGPARAAGRDRRLGAGARGRRGRAASQRDRQYR